MVFQEEWLKSWTRYVTLLKWNGSHPTLSLPCSCSSKHTATLPIYYQTSPTPYSFGHMPPVDTPLTSDPIEALIRVAVTCQRETTT